MPKMREAEKKTRKNRRFFYQVFLGFGVKFYPTQQLAELEGNIELGAFVTMPFPLFKNWFDGISI